MNLKCVIVFLLFPMFGFGEKEATSSEQSQVNVGIILDFNSSFDVMAELCLDMALSDFYSLHSDYQTRLVLHKKNSKCIAGATSAGLLALELLKNEEVQAIIVPQRSTEAASVVQLGGAAHVPIISFLETSPSLSRKQGPYFIRTAPDDSSQVKVIAAIVRGFKWHEIVILCEDTEYHKEFIPILAYTFQEVGIQIPYMVPISTNAEDFAIQKELDKLMETQNRVFLVHMTPSLGSRLFHLTNRSEMMSEGYAWIITEAMSNHLNSMGDKVTALMEGVLGIRSYIQESKDLESFRKRWKRNMLLMQPNSSIMELNPFGLWAYDTVWAVAMAVERIGSTNFSFVKESSNNSSTTVINLPISAVGSRLLSEISKLKFKGLGGEFHLIDRQLQPSGFEIFNVIGKGGDRVVGYWTSDAGITRKLGPSGKTTNSTSVNNLKKIIWPGDTTDTPIGWVIPTTRKKLRVGVPVKTGFTEFVNVSRNSKTSGINVTGFCVDVFMESLKFLPFKVDHEFDPFPKNLGRRVGPYDNILHHVGSQFDMVVGDTTIIADRATYIDFTLPFTESGIVMVVPVKHDKLKDMWIFVKPFRWNLWVTIIAGYIFVGVVFQFLECRMNSPQKILMLLCFPLLALTFPERRMVSNKWSVVVLVTWLVMAYIILQSYTANLASILTVDQLQPILPKHYHVGYQDGSFVKDVLINKLKIDECNLKNYSTVEQYHEALSKGSQNGGVDAIFDEVPYIKIFLRAYDSKYKIVGSTYNTEGFGFAFPIGSSLVTHFSRAILKVIEGDKMREIERRNFGFEYSFQDQLVPISPESPSLSAHSFAGPFIITGLITLVAVLCSEWKNLVAMAKYCVSICFPSAPSNITESLVDSTVELSATNNLPTLHDTQENYLNVSDHTNESAPTDAGEIDDYSNTNEVNSPS